MPPAGGSSVLDAPPPPPGPMGAGGPSGDGGPTLSQFAGPAPIGSANIPPEILTGMMQAADKISQMFDSFAQVTPDLATDWDILKTLFQKTLGKILVAGGTATSPTASAIHAARPNVK